MSLPPGPTETLYRSFDDILDSDFLTFALQAYLHVTPWVPRFILEHFNC